MLKLLYRFVVPLPTLLTFGGSSGDGGVEAALVRLDDAKKAYKKQQDINVIKSVFGDVGADYNISGDAVTSAQGDIAQITARSGFNRNNEDNEDNDLFRPAPPTAPPVLDSLNIGYDPQTLSTAAEDNSAARTATLDKTYGDVMGYYASELDRQKSVEGAKAEADVARRGLTGGTVESSVFDKLNEIYGTQTASLQGKAEGVRTGLKQNDVSLQNELINMIEQGGDVSSTLDYGTRSRVNATDVASQDAMGANLTDLFRNMDEIYGQRQATQGYNAGRREGSSGITTPGSSGSSGSGTIINYGG